MHLATKYLGLVFLTAGLAISAVPRAAAAQEVVVKTGVDHHRYYDRYHHDYHQWDEREDHSYRVYLGERHRDYREFRLSSRQQQDDYWKWRHRHPDHN
ncbi:MAG: hypothetical protein WA765_03785 [Candidatus Acidiferrum sp.]